MNVGDVALRGSGSILPSALPVGELAAARVALARTAAWLLDMRPEWPSDAPGEAHDQAPFLIELPYGSSTVTVVAPPGELDGRPLRWDRAVVPIDRASWR